MSCFNCLRFFFELFSDKHESPGTNLVSSSTPAITSPSPLISARIISFPMDFSSRPPDVPMELHAQNRSKLTRFLRDHLSSSSRPLLGFVLLQGGEEQTRYCTDHVILFRYVVFLKDVASGKSILFAPRLPVDYAVWLGKIKPLSYFKERYMVNEVFYTDEIGRVLHEHYKGSGKPFLFLLHGLNTDSNNFSKPAELEEMEKFDTDLNTLHPILTECRILKSDLELALIQYANDISSEAHIEVKTAFNLVIVWGMGLESTNTGNILENYSAVLHYGHAAAPNERTFEDGDMALLDMGAEYHFYGSDITCSFPPVTDNITSAQDWSLATLSSPPHPPPQSVPSQTQISPKNAALTCPVQIVLWQSFRRCTSLAQSNWLNQDWSLDGLIGLCRLAEKNILECLKSGGVLTGDLDDMMAERLGAAFMPHGLGHFLGIDTHDPGGYTKDMERSKEAGLKSLRTIRELQEGMVITVEPGCYFIDALLNPAIENLNTSKFINRQEISRFRNFGGVRIESDVETGATSDLSEQILRSQTTSYSLGSGNPELPFLAIDTAP
ncbi:hypothetical protein ACLOJK_040049 [Asimina triloba]